MNLIPSFEHWEPLADVLRLELQEYGGLINLLDEQQKGLLGRDHDDLRSMNQAIELQVEASARLRSEREGMVSALAVEAGQPEDTRLTLLLAFFPPGARPLLSALVEEINALLGKIRKRAHQNQLLLARASELTEELIASLRPGHLHKTYGANGRMTLQHPGSAGRVEASA